MAAIECLTEPVYAVGESPVWQAQESALYWVDIPAGRILRLDPASGRLDAWNAAEPVGCIAFASDGTLVAGMQTGVFSLRLAEGGAVLATRLGTPGFALPGMRFNDGRCDRQGRFWAGTMHTDIPAAHAVGCLFRYALPAGLTGPAVSGLVIQNGLAFSPAGDRMYLSDSHPQVRQIWCFDYDTESGTPSNRRLFVDMNAHPGRPDGAAVDEDGCYWTCAADGACLLRFTPEGRLDRKIEMPVKKPTMCAFGGAGLDTLYVTSIRPADPAALADQPLAGAVFALNPGVKGLPETPFASPARNPENTR
jgi:sugar lactone lactonase YvrE